MATTATQMHPKIIMLIGFQASSKSTTAKQIQENVPTAIILSRDTEGGSVESLLSKVELALKDNKVVIVDNTHLTRESRKPFIELARKLKCRIDGHYFKTTIEDCQIRHLYRTHEKYGSIYHINKRDPHCFNPVVLFKARKDLEEPVKSEGFTHLIMREVPSISWPTDRFTNKALFLDIDGTVRKSEHLPKKYPTEPDQVELLHPVDIMRKKLEEYRAQGYRLVGVSNQSGISREDVSQENVEACFEKTRQLLGYTKEEFPILYCPHRSAPISCFCRKPQTGMAMEAIMKWNLNPRDCVMVGDQKTDESMATRLSIKYYDVAHFWE